MRIVGSIADEEAAYGAHTASGGAVRQCRRGLPAKGWGSPVLLVGGMVVAFASLRLTAGDLPGKGDAFQLAQTLLVAGLSMLGLVLGKKIQVRSIFIAGFIGFAVLVARVVFCDLSMLRGFLLLLSVSSLGLTSVVASLSLRRKADWILHKTGMAWKLQFFRESRVEP